MRRAPAEDGVHQRRIPSIWLWASLVLQSMSFGFGKQAAVSMDAMTALGVASNHFYLLSLACLGLQALAWQLALARHPLSFAYLFMTGVFAAVLGLSHFVFGESISIFNLLGAGLIVAGIYLMTGPTGDF